MENPASSTGVPAGTSAMRSHAAAAMAAMLSCVNAGIVRTSAFATSGGATSSQTLASLSIPGSNSSTGFMQAPRRRARAAVRA
jgi:hypothetical protein